MVDNWLLQYDHECHDQEMLPNPRMIAPSCTRPQQGPPKTDPHKAPRKSRPPQGPQTGAKNEGPRQGAQIAAQIAAQSYAQIRPNILSYKCLLKRDSGGLPPDSAQILDFYFRLYYLVSFWGLFSALFWVAISAPFSGGCCGVCSGV